MGKSSGTGDRRGGPRPNSGRKKGSKNKSTIAREIEVSKALKKHNGNRRRGREVMSEVMNYFMGLAARYQPRPSNTRQNEELFVKYAVLAASIGKDIAPYEDPRLAATVLRGDPEQPIRHTIEVEFV